MGIRSFIAINLSESTKEGLEGIKINFKSTLSRSKIKWVDKDNFHITLRFLGDIEPGDITKIEDAIGNFILNYSTFTIEFHEIGVFPGIRKPRILWIGSDYPDIFRNFYSGFRSRLDSIGFLEDKSFLPHITLGRIKYIPERDIRSLKELMSNIKFSYKDTITHIDLMKSQLTPKGPIYTIMKSFYLK